MPQGKNKKIIVIGASGVGKTTLVEKLAPLLALPTIPEIGRILCSEMGYERIGDIPDQEGFKEKVLTTQIKTEDNLASFISDRSTIDSWVLWQRWNICQAMTYTTESFYEKARAQGQKYTHILYLPPMFKPTEDGFRWTNLDYQKQIDRLIRMSLHDFDLWPRTYTLKASQLEGRVQEALHFAAPKNNSSPEPAN
jgi:nicotinamide riboside kinase